MLICFGFNVDEAQPVSAMVVVEAVASVVVVDVVAGEAVDVVADDRQSKRL